MIKFNNHIETVIKIVSEKYADISAKIEVVENMPEGFSQDSLGCTLFPDDGTMPIIFIRYDLPYVGFIDILAHELAHVIVGPNAEEDEHGELFQKAYDWINTEYLKVYN